MRSTTSTFKNTDNKKIDSYKESKLKELKFVPSPVKNKIEDILMSKIETQNSILLNHDSLMKGIVTETVMQVKFDTFKFELLQRIEDKMSEFNAMLTHMLMAKASPH